MYAISIARTLYRYGVFELCPTHLLFRIKVRNWVEGRDASEMDEHSQLQFYMNLFDYPIKNMKNIATDLVCCNQQTNAFRSLLFPFVYCLASITLIYI